LGILGPIEIWDSDDSVVLTPQLRRLVGLLVAADGATVSTDRIAEHVADGRSDGSVIRTAISRLRKSLGNRIETTTTGYRLVLGPGELDADQFVEICGIARSAAPADRRKMLTEGLALWRGRAFDDLADEPWALPSASKLQELRAVATEDLGDVLIELGRAPEAVVLLEDYVAEQPLRERPVALLMRALAASGRVTESLRCFQRFRTTLREQVGIEPTSSLRELEAELLGGLDPERQVEAPVPIRLPVGTVTFMFTDIEGSTERWQHDELAMSTALASHDLTIRSVVSDHGGWVFKHTGDGVCAVFTSAAAAVSAAIDAQKLLTLPVRIGVHTGEAELRDGDYFGPTMNRTARVMDAGHGGQVLVSSSAAPLAGDLGLVDLGEHHLKGLATPERLYQVGGRHFPPLRVARQRLGNIPVELTTFIGRSEEVAELAEELADNRLVTLIGVGGTGKTRMAVEVAHTTAPMFPDGCWLVELASVTVETAVPFAFATGLGIAAPPDRDIVEDITRRLRQKRVLLIVDNCEHLLSAVADVVERIVAMCPAVTVLATSREPLMVSGERLVPVQSLAESDAERLFIERAHTEAPDLVIEDEQAAAVSELCRRLDCLPLAIELAASRVRAFTPIELVANLDERFRLLIGGRRSRMERHQTMRGTLDWSYELCNDTEQAVFDRLSVFPAGFDLAAARAIAARDSVSDLDVIDTVPQLVDRSLLQRSTAADGTTRYRMLETMRAYAREHLQHSGIADSVRECHARYMADLIGRLLLRSYGPDERAVRRRQIEYFSDALVALEWCIDHREWDVALLLSYVGWGVAHRESGEMCARLMDAALESGDDIDFIGVLEHMDVRRAPWESEDVIDARGWAMVHSTDPIPHQYLSIPGHIVLSASIVSYACGRELVSSLDRYEDAPLTVKYLAMWGAARSLIMSGHLELADELLGPLEEIVAELDSESAAGTVAELRGHIGVWNLDWVEAAHWFAIAAQSHAHDRPNWFKLAVSWHSLTARTLAGYWLTGSEISDPWRWLRAESITVLVWHGAVSTALALDRLGYHDLAERLIRWARCSDPGGVMDRFLRILRLADLDIEPGDSDDDLETLIDEVLIIADELDRHPGLV
jgi:predicted ATPase/class 3 adenylate cyclase